MHFNFELIFVTLTFLTGIVTLWDQLFRRKERKQKMQTEKVEAEQDLMPWYVDYSRSLFPIFLVVLLLRSFLFEPYRIPSGSLEPTLLVGDFILVNKFEYGLRLPVIYKKIVEVHEPKRGDIVVFRWPVNPKIDFIKRIVGVPGDKLSYINKQLYVNGLPMPQKFVKNTTDDEPGQLNMPVDEMQEDLTSVIHDIYVNPDKPAVNFYNVEVPPGHYFVMGDNRDNSDDSRYWGLLPEANIVGKAQFILFSWNTDHFGFRSHRFFNSIN